MEEFFTIDRSGLLQEGQQLTIDNDYAGLMLGSVQDHFTEEELLGLTEQLFPEGLSKHGKFYLLNHSLIVRGPNGPEPVVPNCPVIELIFELVRRLYYPEKPSRMTAAFAWRSLEAAMEYRNIWGGRIFRVSAPSSFTADMKLLLLGGTNIGALKFARKYWEGHVSPNPVMETLLSWPVQIHEAIAHEG